MPKERSSRKPIPNQVTDYIFTYIRRNALRTGDSVPSELRTATDLGISRSMVREAFRSLQVAGIIEKGNGRSPKVAAVNGDFLSQLMQHALSTQQVSPEHVLDVRAALEVRAAELAAISRSASEVRQLRDAVRGMKQAVATPERFVQHDLDFHQVLLHASANTLVLILGEAIHESMRQTMHAGLLTRSRRADIQRIVKTHSEIADAVESKSARAAGAAMKRHFAEAKQAFRQAQQSVDL